MYQPEPFYFLSVLRRGIGNNCFSVPPNVASLLLLSRAINASKPSLTKDVFSVTPVNFEALLSNWSSIFKVVRMTSTFEYAILVCIIMHVKYIHVKISIDFSRPERLVLNTAALFHRSHREFDARSPLGRTKTPGVFTGGFYVGAAVQLPPQHNDLNEQ